MAGHDENGRPDGAVFNGQIALLGKGCRAALWACREVLGLGAEVNSDDIRTALHKTVHRIARDETVCRDKTRLLAAVTAARLLLMALGDD